MQTLRNSIRLARLVLAGMLLSLGLAVASPLVQPQNMLLVCTGSGAMKVVQIADDGSTSEASAGAMDCPLCATVGAPPPAFAALPGPLSPLTHALQSIPRAHIAARTAAPLPARGPPIL
jgi:hypothetical protein